MENNQPQSEKITDGVPTGFYVSKEGVYKIDINKNGKELEQHICSELMIVAQTRDDDNTSWGKLIKVKDQDGIWHEYVMPMEMLSGTKEDYLKALLSMGLMINHTPYCKNALYEFISSSKPSARARCVKRIGWYGNQFVLPGEVFGQNGGERPVLEGQIGNPFKSHGSLKDWKKEVAKYCEGNSRLQLTMCAALAGPALGLCGEENGGIHLFGSSSSGKTTALKVASSVLGGGNGISGFMQNWRSTDNGLEAIAARHCDATLFLDELNQADANTASKTAYMLANGVGKQRAKKDGSQKDISEWRLLFASTGEGTLDDKIKEEGKGKSKAGQQVRVLDIPAETGSGFGLFQDLHGFEDGDVFSRKLKDAASENYGTAFKEFLGHIVESRDEVAKSIRSKIDTFINDSTTSDSAPQVKRAARRFGLLGAVGEIAIDKNVLPWSEGSAIQAAKTCFQSWKEQRGGDSENTEEKQAIELVKNFIDKYGSSRFQNIKKEDEKIHNRAGFKTVENGYMKYFIFPHSMKEICNGLNSDTVAKKLNKHGMLETEKDKYQSRKSLPGLGRIRVYAILYGENDDDKEKDNHIF